MGLGGFSDRKPLKIIQQDLRVSSLFDEVKKFRTYIEIKGKRMELGLFDNLKDAVKARKEAEEKYHKPYIDAGRKEVASEILAFHAPNILLIFFNASSRTFCKHIPYVVPEGILVYHTYPVPVVSVM